jgi:hypothetical protein
VFTPVFKQWFEQLVAHVERHAPYVYCSSQTLPDVANGVNIISFPAANKCVKCNRFFYSKGGHAVGELAFYVCAAASGKCTDIYADKCVKCTLLHWIMTCVGGAGNSARKRSPARTWDTSMFTGPAEGASGASGTGKLPTVPCSKCKASHWDPSCLYKLVPK